jgi:hypothetical protein
MALLWIVLAAWVGTCLGLGALWIGVSWYFGYRPARRRRTDVMVSYQLHPTGWKAVRPDA